MSDHNRRYDAIGDDRSALFGEMDRFISPDGAFDEQRFRASLRSLLETIKKSGKKNGRFEESVNGWLSMNLPDVIEFCEERTSVASILKIVNAALDEAGSFGLAISADHLKQVISLFGGNGSAGEKKTGPDIKRKKIFDAALRVFAQKGYHNATIDEVAALSGVGKGSVYRYFKSKEDLLTQLLTEHYEIIVGRISQIFSLEHDVLKQIREMIEVWVKFIEENYIVYQLIQSEAISGKAGEATMFYDYFITQFPMFKDSIVAMNREKRLKTTNFYTVFYGALGLIDGVVHKWFRQGMNYPLSDEIPVILEVIFNGFVGESQTGEHFYPALEDKNGGE
ncbi:MAG TPA: TetR/AcrR family transcriptional regulator [Spirochaetota bacterium]|nr:TetR/AcrR family transcriptional regulator [Spirochaetota bacterium]HQL81378.1 TetR/AcrR family transcriptional regulator [Spirochaetota bacterium]